MDGFALFPQRSVTSSSLTDTGWVWKGLSRPQTPTFVKKCYSVISPLTDPVHCSQAWCLRILGWGHLIFFFQSRKRLTVKPSMTMSWDRRLGDSADICFSHLRGGQSSHYTHGHLIDYGDLIMSPDHPWWPMGCDVKVHLHPW